jgi:hypothetical protein
LGVEPEAALQFFDPLKRERQRLAKLGDFDVTGRKLVAQPRILGFQFGDAHVALVGGVSISIMLSVEIKGAQAMAKVLCGSIFGSPPERLPVILTS